MSESAAAMLPAMGWMTLREASALLGAHTNTVRRWVDSGAIGSYRTLGGHRRVAQQDVQALARATAAAGDITEEASALAEPAVALIEATLRGEVSPRECRLRLRTLGRNRGRAAATAGMRLSELVSEHAGVRRAIAGLVESSGQSEAVLDERGRWADGLADVLLLGLSEGMDTIPVRVSTVRGWSAG